MPKPGKEPLKRLRVLKGPEYLQASLFLRQSAAISIDARGVIESRRTLWPKGRWRAGQRPQRTFEGRSR